MLATLLLLTLGLALLIFGADALVRGVSAIAAALGVPPLIVGMTVVAFGTSMPEIVVNTVSAWRGETDLAFGNIVGSCAVNIGFVLGVIALVRPLDVQASVLTREAPLMLLAVASLVVLGEDRLLENAAANVLSRSDGLMLLLLFIVFLYVTVLAIRNQADSKVFLDEIRHADSPVRPPRLKWGRDAAFTVGGLVGVAIGGRLVVAQAVTLAQLIGVSDTLIGLTVVSLGTTLPELTTGIIAARRGLSDIAVGNVIGSCIFNLLFIGGLAATIHPLAVPTEGLYDVALLVVLAFLLLPMTVSGHRITRPEGAGLLAIYLGYMTWRILAMPGAA
jgi:cation:H+ antiporter